MTNNLPSLLVAVIDHAAVVKVNGRANFTTSVSFKRLVTELRERGFERFTLDLSDCITMDSTFLGVLAGTALKLSEARAEQGQDEPSQPSLDGQLCLLNPNQRVVELLDNLGVCDLFRTIHSQTPAASAQELTPAAELKASREEVSRNCLEAHQLLMSLSPQNVPRFKDVTQFLAEDLKRLGSERSENKALDATSPNSPEVEDKDTSENGHGQRGSTG